MSKSKNTAKKNRPPARWSAEDRQAFADRNILRAQRIPNKKRVAARKACRGRVSVD
jgi:hypothetical protein